MYTEIFTQPVMYSASDTDFSELERHLLQGAETFDTRVWVAAVGIVMGTLMILGFGTCFLLCRECRASCKHILVILELSLCFYSVSFNRFVSATS